MTEIQERLNQAYTLISGITVSGTNVKRLAMAMQVMEDTFKLLSEKEEKDDG